MGRQTGIWAWVCAGVLGTSAPVAAQVPAGTTPPPPPTASAPATQVSPRAAGPATSQLDPPAPTPAPARGRTARVENAPSLPEQPPSRTGPGDAGGKARRDQKPAVALAPPSPEVVARAAAPAVTTPRPEDADPWARPHFVKGELNSFAVRPTTRRNYIGVGGGVSALPSSEDTALNAFYLSVEPQLDFANRTYNWRLGLGAPLNFELVDTRGAFEVCVGEARTARARGADSVGVSSAAADCLRTQQNRLTANTGRLRRADWDEASDFAKVIRYITIGTREQPFYLSLSRLYDQTFGHGTVVRHYNPNIDYNTARVGANLDFNRSAIGVQAMANDLVSPDVLGLMTFLRPLRPFSSDVLGRSFSIGLSWVHGVNQPRSLKYERGLFGAAFDQPMPEVDANLDPVAAQYEQVSIVGVDIETKVLRTATADVKVYFDYQKMMRYGGGSTLGSLWRFSFGEPAKQALRARAEVMFFDPDYLPNYFDAYRDVFQYQYMPAAYWSSNGIRYFPTKLEFLEANRGGREKVGGYVELTYAYFDLLTLGVVARGWRPTGKPRQMGFVGPSFADYGQPCSNTDNGGLACQNQIEFFRETPFGSFRVHAELPFKKFLQAYASYEVFTTTAEDGITAFAFDGDNEVFLSGARLALLPILFIQAEARRYFFLQRLSNVNLETLSIAQDHTFHSRWTFSINASLGYEF